MDLFSILFAGINALQEYIMQHTLTCLVPALFIAGAISILISKESVIKYFGAKTKKSVSYLVASVSGTLLAVAPVQFFPYSQVSAKKEQDLVPQ